MNDRDQAEAWREADLRIREEIREFGEVRSGHFAGRQVLLLTTTGARSGEPRTSVLSFSRHDDHYVIIGSKGGGPEHPAWYRNLKANPTATVEVGLERFEVRAIDTTGAARDQLYAAHAELYPAFAQYEGMTDRVIPVVQLERTDQASD